MDICCSFVGLIVVLVLLVDRYEWEFLIDASKVFATNLTWMLKNITADNILSRFGQIFLQLTSDAQKRCKKKFGYPQMIMCADNQQ